MHGVHDKKHVSEVDNDNFVKKMSIDQLAEALRFLADQQTKLWAMLLQEQ